MKKLLLIPLMMLSVTMFAQTFQFGLKAGLNVSNFTGSTFENVDKKALVGFHGGAFLSLLLGNYFAIQPEALFSSQGAKFKNADESANFRVSYLTVPVMAKIRFPGGFYVEAGPQVGFKLHESYPGSGTAGDFANNGDFAIDAGLGFHGKSGFGIGGRYVIGISKVGNVDNADFNDPNFKNGVAQIFLFYTLFNNKNTP
jgi:hypothetical protein